MRKTLLLVLFLAPLAFAQVVDECVPAYPPDACAASGVGVTPVNPLLAGMTECWAFDEVSTGVAQVDRVGWRGATLTDFNTTPSTAGHLGANAARFTSADDDYLRIADLGAGFDWSQDFTIALWVRIRAWTTNTYWMGGPAGTVAHWFNNTPGQVLFVYQPTAAGFQDTDLNDWVYMVMSYDSNRAGSQDMYTGIGRVGELFEIVLADGVYTPVGTTGQFAIGAFGTGLLNCDCDVDNVMIFNENKLTDLTFPYDQDPWMNGTFNSGAGIPCP